MKDRLDFAHQMKHNLETETRQIFFSDETHVQMGAPTHRGLHQWAPKNAKPAPLEISTAQCQYVSFSAFVSRRHKFPLRPLEQPKFGANGIPLKNADGSIRMVNAKIDSIAYIELVLKPLKEDLIKIGLWRDNKALCILMQDGAPSHCSAVTMEWIDANFGLENWITRAPEAYKHKVYSFWPAHSPGANPLDFSIWNELKKIMTEQSNNGIYKTRQECIDLALKVWNALSEEYVGNCCDGGFRRRLDRIIAAEGHTEVRRPTPRQPANAPAAFPFGDVNSP